MRTVLHSGQAHVVGGRDGQATTADGIVNVPLRRPALAAAGSGTTPEALFAAAYAACFSGAIGRIRRERSLPAVEIVADCTVSLVEQEDGFGLEAEIAITLPDTSAEDAVEQVRAAHVICPYSRAIANNVPVSLSANGLSVGSE